jgi:hypothetical protein
MTRAPTEARTDQVDIAYSESWMNGFIRWIERLPGPSWLFYLIGFIVLGLLVHLIFWVDGSLPLGQFVPFRFTDGGYLVIFVGLFHHLRIVARQSFQKFKEVLPANRSEIEGYEYSLTTLPRQWGLVWLLLGLVLILPSAIMAPESFGLVGTKTLLPWVYQGFVAFIGGAFFGCLVVQTIRQVLLVNALHREAVGVNLFQLEPAHALATLTARAGIGLILFIIYSGLVERTFISVAHLISLGIVAVLALATFTLPLLGMRGRLMAEKSRLLGETNHAIELTIQRIHQAVNANAHENIGDLETALKALT